MSKTNRLIFEKRTMIHVSIEQAPMKWPTCSPFDLLDEDRMREVTSNWSFSQSATVCVMVDCELKRRGLRHARVGGRHWCACEARIVSDVVTLELDLFEIAVQIQEARWEQGA